MLFEWLAVRAVIFRCSVNVRPYQVALSSIQLIHFKIYLWDETTRYLTFEGKSLGSTTTAATPNAELGSWPFINDDKAHSILSNHHLFHRYTRGVHDECCVKGCTFKELTSYCTRPN